MKYFIKRELSEYGPYSLAELQKYVGSGQIAPTDLCRSEGMTDWVPVTQVVGNVSVPVTAPAGTAYGGAPALAFSHTPSPPNLQWALVLLISIFTCGLFGTIWLLVQAAFVKKIDLESKALTWLIIFIAGAWVIPIAMSLALGDASETGGAITGLGYLAGLVFYLVAIFQMKSSFENYYLNQFGNHRGLSGVMVFFFAPYYFQFHINETETLKTQTAGRV